MFVKIVLSMLALIALISVGIILTGPTIWDRLLGLSLFSSKLIMMIVLLAFVLQKSYYLDIALVYVLLGFISIVFISNFIKGRGKI
jgi:multicomponent Na+:H+ antiporter subunit F